MAQHGAKTREQAALLVAEDELTEQEIAEAAGIGRRTLVRWKNDPDFAALVGEHVGRIQAAMLKHAIAKKHKRIAVLDTLHAKALAVIAARADDASMADAPGGDTGLMVRQLKVIGAGKNMQVVEEYTVDTGLLREIRALHEQTAKELGQWVDRTESDVTMTEVQVVGVNVEQL